MALVPAAKEILGEFYAWEPESIWLTLTRQGVEVPDVNRAKLLAALTLYTVPSFYWDGIVFEKTALAFDGVIPNPEVLEEATSAQLAWAVKEAAWVKAYFNDPAVEFQHEPKAYAAVVMHREGLVLAPAALEFAQALLEQMNRGGVDKTDTEKAWAAIDKKTLATHTFSETPADVQLARLAAIELYVREREVRAKVDLARLA